MNHNSIQILFITFVTMSTLGNTFAAPGAAPRELSAPPSIPSAIPVGVKN